MASSPSPKEGSYGATDEAGVNKAADWEWRGDPWWLMLDVAQLYGRQLVMLMAVVVAVFTSKDYLMNCNPTVSSYAMATMCEYTKAHVRCFPLLALVVSLFAACKMYLYLRIFYQMLKRGVLIEFEAFPPYKDPLFQILVFCMSQALLHFVLNISTVWGIQLNAQDIKGKIDVVKAEEFQTSVYELAAFYLTPSALFFALFYATYDVSESVLPFSKYFEGDNEGALQKVKHLTVVPEAIAMNAVQTDLLQDVGYCTADTLYARFLLEVAEAKSDAGKGTRQLSVWRLSSAWWPARLLLDYRIAGREGMQYRHAWWVFILPVVAVTVFVAWFCALVVFDKVVDVAHGQYEDLAGLIVGVAINLMIVRFGYEFSIKTVVLPIVGYKFIS